MSTAIGTPQHKRCRRTKSLKSGSARSTLCDDQVGLAGPAQPLSRPLLTEKFTLRTPIFSAAAGRIGRIDPEHGIPIFIKFWSK